jgi:hypothetical protein
MNRRFWISFGVSIFAVVMVGEWYRGVIALQQPPFRPELAGAADGLRTLIWTDEAGIASFDQVRIWISCDNRTGGDVRNLRFLSFETPGFDKSDCWNGDQPACAPGSKVKAGLPPLLSDGRVVTVYAKLRPKPRFGRHGASGILTWRDQKGRDFERAVILPGLEIHDPLMDWFASMAKAIEICALPFLFAFVSWRWKVDADHRERRERDLREQRENQERQERDWQLQLQGAWSLQLPKVIDNISRYYLPFASAMQMLIDYKKTPRSEDELYHLLFRVMRLLRRAAHLAEGVGAFFFKDLAAEDRASECYLLFQLRSREFLPEEDQARILDAIGPSTGLAQFMDLAKGQAEGTTGRDTRRRKESMQRLLAGLERWVGTDSFQQDLVPIEILSRIVWFEVNRPVELWYGHLPEFPSADWRNTLSRLDIRHTELRENLKQYGEECESAARLSIDRWRRRKATEVPHLNGADPGTVPGALGETTAGPLPAGSS